MDKTHCIEQLEKLLEDGRPRSKLELACINRQLDDLRHGHERGLFWDAEEAERTLKFFKLMRHYKGRWADTLFEPEPWQIYCVITPMYAWTHDKPRSEGGLRRFRTAYIEVPRKNGKTFLVAGCALKGALADYENSPEIYTAATTKSQAMLCFEDICNIASAPLRRELDIYAREIKLKGKPGHIKPTSAEHKNLDGLNVHYGVVDELHAHPNARLYSVIQSGCGARDNPLMLAITTAGYDRTSICWEQREYASAVLSKSHDDDAFFCFIATVDEDDDWSDPETWRKANPNLGVSVYEKFLGDEYKKASLNPLQENEFRRKHLNQWTSRSVVWISQDAFDNCNSEIISDEDLSAYPCHAGIDLSRTRDTSAIVLCFDMGEGKFYFKNWIFAPAESSTKQQRSDRRYIEQWIEKKAIIATPGDEIDFRTIQATLQKEILAKYQVQSIAFDPAFSTGFIQNCLEDGIPEEMFVKFTQNAMNYNEPCRYLESAIAEKKIWHEGSKVLSWMIGNVEIKEDHNENIRPDKANSQGKIDGVVSMLMALGRCLEEQKINTEPQIYTL